MIPNWLLQRAFITPSKHALTYEGRHWTFEQLKNDAVAIAEKLTTIGMTKGQRVAILSNSTADMVLMMHACLLKGVELVLLNARLTKNELEYQLQDSEAVYLLVDDELIDKVAHIDTLHYRFSSIARQTQSPFQLEKEWDKERTLTIMYTSGTTGFPKGVRQTANNHTSSAVSSVLNLGLDEDDCWLCMMPLFHISGFSILVRSVLYGSAVHLYDKFNAEQAALLIKDGFVTHMSIVAATLKKLLNDLEQSSSIAHPRFKAILAGGGAVPKDYLERAIARQIPILQTYGMTETSSQTTTLSPADAMRKIGSAGKPLFFNQVQIKGANAPFEHGEVLIKGPHVTPGYIGRFELQSPVNNGWLQSGDIGYVDEEGYVFIVDRRADLIISGGENIYPAEIENVLASHPAIVEVGVCGRANEQWGAVPIAYIVLKEPVSDEALEVFCLERLARYKVPKAFIEVNELPRNASNKLLRNKLKDLK